MPHMMTTKRIRKWRDYKETIVEGMGDEVKLGGQVAQGIYSAAEPDWDPGKKAGNAVHQSHGKLGQGFSVAITAHNNFLAG